MRFAQFEQAARIHDAARGGLSRPADAVCKETAPLVRLKIINTRDLRQQSIPNWRCQAISSDFVSNALNIAGFASTSGSTDSTGPTADLLELFDGSTYEQ